MTSPVSMPAGHAIIATDLDAYENLTSAWTSYTPTWTATSVNPAIGNGTIVGGYIRAGRLMIVRGRVDMGSTTTFGTGIYNFSLPAQFNSSASVGVAYLSDATGQPYPAAVGFFGSTIFLMSQSGNVTQAVPFTWAQSDNLAWTAIYETT